MSAEKEGAAIEQHENRTESVDDIALSKDWAHNDGKQGAAQEHQMTLMEGIKGYPGAIMWSVLLSTAIIMGRYLDDLHRLKQRVLYCASTLPCPLLS